MACPRGAPDLAAAVGPRKTAGGRYRAAARFHHDQRASSMEHRASRIEEEAAEAAEAARAALAIACQPIRGLARSPSLASANGDSVTLLAGQ